jgi:hypothetical protein
MSWKRILAVLVVVAGFSLIAVGCGDDEDDSDTTDVSVPSISVPTDAESAEEVQEDVSEAVETAKSQAYDECIDAANQIPDGSQKDQAVQTCESLK